MIEVILFEMFVNMLFFNWNIEDYFYIKKKKSRF